MVFTVSAKRHGPFLVVLCLVALQMTMVIRVTKLSTPELRKLTSVLKFRVRCKRYFMPVGDFYLLVCLVLK